MDNTPPKNGDQLNDKNSIGEFLKELIESSQQSIEKKSFLIMSILSEMKEENNKLISKGKSKKSNNNK